MLVSEAIKILEAKFSEIYEQDEFPVYGLRFEDKERQVGDLCENSRNNIDREDERDFPEFGTEEYEEMEEMDGASAWHPNHILAELKREKGDEDVAKITYSKHAYIVGGQREGWEQTNGLVDEGETLVQDAQVLYVLY